MRKQYEIPEYRRFSVPDTDILTLSPQSDANNDELPIIPIKKP